MENYEFTHNLLLFINKIIINFHYPLHLNLKLLKHQILQILVFLKNYQTLFPHHLSNLLTYFIYIKKNLF